MDCIDQETFPTRIYLHPRCVFLQPAGRDRAVCKDVADRPKRVRSGSIKYVNKVSLSLWGNF